jgi:hypothetical protein
VTEISGDAGPTLGQVYWDTWSEGARKIPYADLAVEYREHTERAAAAVGAAAIARLQREEPHAAPELAAAVRALDIARDEITGLRNRCGRLLGEFGRGSDGYRARLSGTVLAREYRDAGLPVPDRLSHLEGK